MKNVLLAVCGLSPQVITETLYALHQSGRKVDAINIITTREGKDRIFTSLLSPKDGQFSRYLKEYGYPLHEIAFNASSIHVVTRDNGREIMDIADEADSEAVLKKCLELGFQLTRDPETAVFFSVAGGRKTMSACLTLAAQMYGRPQDRLYHVLVSPEYESNPDFYYPPKESKPIPLKDKMGHPYYKESRYAQINLVHLPFVSIRNQIPPHLLDKPLDPATLMLSLIREEKNRLSINLIKGKIIYREIELDLMPARMALYAFFAMRKKECKIPGNGCGNCINCFADIGQVFHAQHRITEIYRRLCGTRPIEEMSDTGIVNLNADNFNMYKGKIRKDLINCFGQYALKDLEIASIGRRPNTRYGIRIDRDRIEVVY
jgi:CRISPR-associated protein Csx14